MVDIVQAVVALDVGSERHDPGDTMIQSLGDPLDDISLPRRLATLDDDRHTQALLFDLLL